MIQFPSSDEVVDGLQAAFNLICGSDSFGGFESWLGQAAYLDCKDGEGRVFHLGSELTRIAKECLACGLLTASEKDELLIFNAAAVLEAANTVHLVAVGFSHEYRVQEQSSD